ncbi:MAG: acyl-CoA dehydrogenase family protein, partial [Nocardioides sp.]
MSLPVDRLLPTEEAHALLDLTRELAEKELAPQVRDLEARAEFPAAAYALLGQSGLKGLPFAEEFGGGAQPYEVYLQVIEELAMVWPSVAVGMSVHTLTVSVLDTHGTAEQRAEWLPRMLGGDWLGAYALSEPQAGSDVNAIRTRAQRDGDDYVLTGVKQWISNGSHADYYVLFARTSDAARGGLSCFLITADSAGLSFGAPERKLGLHCDVTTQVILDQVRVPAARRIGAEGDGMRIALGALDGGRLGIAAVGTGLAHGALAQAVAYAGQREQFGQKIGEFQGMQFLLADMAARVERSRAMYLHAARLKDSGRPFARQASIAKLGATDSAMAVATDAIQVFGG